MAKEWIPAVEKKLADHKPAPRTCLRCEQLFNSMGPANRICLACAARQPELSARETKANRDLLK